MKVFKFGGASVKDASGVVNLKKILRYYAADSLVIVISAIGKTTNLLERILNAYYYDPSSLPGLLAALRQGHYDIVNALVDDNQRIISKLDVIFDQLETKLLQAHSDNFDFDYDWIVSYGEILSTKLISTYLNIEGIKNQWIDARDLVRTDSTYREGKVDWDITSQAIQQRVGDILSRKGDNLIITQGFIGATAEKLSTTLGREGSDYSAAIFAYALDAESVTIWKDVPGLLNADPKLFPDAVKLDRISYEEAIELSYYGATIIHPKTLKPLQNKQIALYVKPFFDFKAQGSVIENCESKITIPSFIVKKNQLLLSIFPKDFSFIAVDNLSEIFSVFSKHRVTINLMQNSALSFSVCTDYDPHRLEAVLADLSANYKLKYNEGIELITIRHYSPESINKVILNKTLLVEQKNRTTIQLVIQP